MCIGRFALFLTNLHRHGILEQKESTTLIGGPDEGFLDIILCHMWCLAMALELIVASVDDPAVLVGRMPDLSPVPASALAALDFAGEDGYAAVQFHRPGLFLVDGQIPIRPFVIAQKMPVGNTHLAVSEPLPMAPGHVFRNAPAFFLCQAAHDSDEEFPFTNQSDTK